VAAGELVEHSALRGASGGLFLLGRSGGLPGVGPSAALGLGAASALCRAGTDKIALYVGQATEYGQHQAPGAGAGVGPRLGQWSELRLASTMRLTMPNRSKVLRARRSMGITVTVSPAARLLRSLSSSRRSLCAPVTLSR
jgi:hypothetical protein